MYLHTYSLSFKLFRSIDQWYLHSLTSWWIIRRRLLFFPSPLPLSPSLSFLSDGIHFPAETCRFTRSPHTRFPRISVNDGKVDWRLRLVFPLFFNFFFCELRFRKVWKDGDMIKRVSLQFRNEGSPGHAIDTRAFYELPKITNLNCLN